MSAGDGTTRRRRRVIPGAFVCAAVVLWSSSLAGCGFKRDVDRLCEMAEEMAAREDLDPPARWRELFRQFAPRSERGAYFKVSGEKLPAKSVLPALVLEYNTVFYTFECPALSSLWYQADEAEACAAYRRRCQRCGYPQQTCTEMRLKCRAAGTDPARCCYGLVEKLESGQLRCRKR